MPTELKQLLSRLEQRLLQAREKEIAPCSVLPNCWEMLNCRKKRCVVYGRAGVRCWQQAGHLCFSRRKATSGRRVRTPDSCRTCPVYGRATSTASSMNYELLNNISHIFVRRFLDPGKWNPNDQLEGVRNRFALTPRETECLSHALQRRQRSEIATLVGISNETAKMHLSNLFRKLRGDGPQLSRKACLQRVTELLRDAAP